MTNQWTFIAALSLITLAACSSPTTRERTPSPASSKDTTRSAYETSQVIGEPPSRFPSIESKEMAIDKINEQIVAATEYCRISKGRYPDLKTDNGKIVRLLCTDIYTNGNALIATIGDFVATNIWNSRTINVRASTLDTLITNVRNKAFDDTESSSFRSIADLLVEIGFGIWDHWRSRSQDDRMEIATLIRGKTFVSYDSIPKSGEEPAPNSTEKPVATPANP